MKHQGVIELFSINVTIATCGWDRKGTILVVVRSLLLSDLEGSVDFCVFIKANTHGGVGIWTTIFATHLESFCCAAASFW